MDKVIMNELVFYGYHGVLDFEKKNGQTFIISIEIYGDFYKASMSDNVEDAINYNSVYIDVKDIVENNNFNLIEALGGNIANMILNKYESALEVKVKVLKPQAPVKGIFESFGVEICRQR